MVACVRAAIVMVSLTVHMQLCKPQQTSTTQTTTALSICAGIWAVHFDVAASEGEQHSVCVCMQCVHNAKLTSSLLSLPA